jgi:hypothetical protein
MTAESTQGFRVEQRTAAIDFAEDSPWHGATARVVISVPFKILLWYQRNAESKDVEMSSESLHQWGDKYLLEWNLLDDTGEPIPATGQGAEETDDSDIVTAMMLAWMEAVVHPAGPLSAQYNSGATSEAESMVELASASTAQPNSRKRA